MRCVKWYPLSLWFWPPLILHLSHGCYYWPQQNCSWPLPAKSNYHFTLLGIVFFFIFVVKWNHDSIVKFCIVESQFHYFRCCLCTMESWFHFATKPVAEWNCDSVVWNFTLSFCIFFEGKKCTTELWFRCTRTTESHFSGTIMF